MSNLKHAFIVSEPELSRIEDESYHLCLAHLMADENYAAYREFYHNQAQREGSYVVQDNSLFELKESADWEKLMLAVRSQSINEIVIPEVLRDASASMEAQNQFLYLYYDEINQAGIKISAVLQGKSFDDIYKHYKALISDRRIDRIMIPFNFEFSASGDDITKDSFYWHSGFNRFELLCALFSHHLSDRDETSSVLTREPKPIHLLGLFNPIELTLYTKFFTENGSMDMFKSRNSFCEMWTILFANDTNGRSLTFSQACYNATVGEWIQKYVQGNDSSSCFWHSLYGVAYSVKYGLLHRKIETHVDFKQRFIYEEQVRLFERNKDVLQVYFS